jgi:hypothetical protein
VTAIDRTDEVPAVVVEHVRGLLDLSDEVTAEHDADRTAKWHRRLVRALVGVKYDAGKARVIAEEAIRRAVTTKDNPADLINVALEELVRARCELPGFSTLDRLVAAIRRRRTPRCTRWSRHGSTWPPRPG